MSFVNIQNLTKQFPGVLAVDNVSFDVNKGDFVTILGPSGSGKSTLLRMIAGFEDPTSGKITIDQKEVTSDPPFKRELNMMFQDHALFPHLSVNENIAYGLKRKGVPKEERQKRIESMLETVRLSGYGDRNPSELSGGEQQRVALARALVNEPKVVLFDEPLASLDRKLRQHMQFELQRIQRDTGTTFIYVTHDQEIAMSLSDRLILLNDGSIEQTGSVEELYNRPASKFVADFIGDVNIIPGNLTDTTGGAYTVKVNGSTKQVPPLTSLNGLSTGENVSMCVRPHDIRLAEAGVDHPDDIMSLSGEISNRVYMGERLVYRVETSTGVIEIESENPEYDIGDSVHVTWPISNMYLFSDSQEEEKPVQADESSSKEADA